MASQQSGLSASEEIPVEGSLSYWTTVVNKWQNRWCVLKEDGYLYYYASKEKMKRAVHKGRIRLKRAILGPPEQEPDNISFTIVLDKETYKFQASTEEEKEKWIKSLRAIIQQLSCRGDKGQMKNAQLVHSDTTSEEEENASGVEGEDSEVNLLADLQDTPPDNSNLTPQVVSPLASVSSGQASVLSSVGGASSLIVKLGPSDHTLMEDPDDVEIDENVFSEGTDTTDSLQNHRSMVLHILSQLRLGMDLTKVVTADIYS